MVFKKCHRAREFVKPCKELADQNQKNCKVIYFGGDRCHVPKDFVKCPFYGLDDKDMLDKIAKKIEKEGTGPYVYQGILGMLKEYYKCDF